jgi:methionyl-tRNA formyltransferase
MRVVFMGTPEFAIPALKALIADHEVVLVVTQPDKPAGRKKRLQSPPVKTVAEQAGLKVIQPSSARSDDFLQAMQEAAADAAVVVAYGKLLPAAVLGAFPLGCINIHGSLLPKYRGAAPIQRAVIDGVSETGVSIMRLDEGMDTGPVLLTKREAIGAEDTSGDLFERLAPLGAQALIEALAGLAEGTLEARAQPELGASHAAMLTKEDGLVPWSEAAAVVSARIRGVDPWPGAFTHFDGGKLKLFGARVCDAEDNAEGDAEPGTLLSFDDLGMRVACGSGACLVAEVQAPGKKRMAAAVFARGRRLSPGIVFPESAPESGS